MSLLAHFSGETRPIESLEDVRRKELLLAPASLSEIPKKLARPWISPFSPDDWMTVKDYNYRGIVIPAGFVFDGASIPKLIGVLYQKSDPHWIIAALIHDWLYFTRMYPRWVADSFLEEVMLLQGNPPLRAKLFHKAVAWFGAKAFKG